MIEILGEKWDPYLGFLSDVYDGAEECEYDSEPDDTPEDFE